MILFGANAQLASLRDKREVTSRERSKSSPRNKKRNRSSQQTDRRDTEKTLDLMRETVFPSG